MKLYLLGKEELRDYLEQTEFGKSGMSVIDIVSRMNGFVALHGDQLLFNRRVKSNSLIEQSSEFPLTYAYSVDINTVSGLRLHQAIREWCELEAILKEDHDIDPDDTILYVEKANRKFFVKTQKKYNQFEEVATEAVLADIRRSEFAEEMFSILNHLYDQYEAEALPMRKMTHCVRIQSMLTILSSKGIGIPEKFMRFQSDRAAEVGDEDFD